MPKAGLKGRVSPSVGRWRSHRWGEEETKKRGSPELSCLFKASQRHGGDVRVPGHPPRKIGGATLERREA